jgi:hypothetical protein
MQCSKFQGCGDPVALGDGGSEREACLADQGVTLCAAATPAMIAT